MKHLPRALLCASPFLLLAVCYTAGHWLNRECWHWGDVGMILSWGACGLLLGAEMAASTLGDQLANAKEHIRKLEGEAWTERTRRELADDMAKQRDAAGHRADRN